MIKFLLIPLFLFSFNHSVNVTIIDSRTKEPLCGVLNQHNYSDINGSLIVRRNNSLNLKFISYEDINIKNIQNDTIIKMNPLR